MRNPLAAHPPWRQLTIIAVLLPLIIVLAVLAFAWPAARIAPRDLPVGIAGTGAGSQQVLAGLTRSDPGGFDVKWYADERSARSAIENRDIYGAFVVGADGITVLEASAASPSVAQLLSTVAQRLAVQVRDVDVVPLSAGDPRGLVLPSALLPMTICGVIMASVIGLVLEFRPAWRQIMALIVVSATAGLGAYLIAQGFLGALPHQAVATWAAMSLVLLAIGATTAGLIALIGAGGLGLGVVLMVLVGNPFSGATSAPELLPEPVGAIGQWLPPGAGANLIRSTAYFDGHGASGHLIVLIAWIVFGLVAVIVGHHAPVRFAARRAWKPAAEIRPDATVADHGGYDEGALVLAGGTNHGRSDEWFYCVSDGRAEQMSMDGRIERSRLLYERALFESDAGALAEAERELDGVEADLAVARGRVIHGRFLTQRAEDPELAREDPDELALFERAVALYRSLGDVRGEGEALFWVGCCHQVVRHDNEAAVPVLWRSLELATETDDTVVMSEALRHLGIAEHAAGRLDTARLHLEESTRLRREIGAWPGVASNLVGLIYIAAGQDRREDALKLAAEARSIAEASGAHGLLRQIDEASAQL